MHLDNATVLITGARRGTGLAFTKAALAPRRGLCNDLHCESRGQKTQVTTLHMAFVDTDMTQAIDAPTSMPEAIVARALDALDAGADDVLADERMKQARLDLSAQPGVYCQARD